MIDSKYYSLLNCDQLFISYFCHCLLTIIPILLQNHISTSKNRDPGSHISPQLSWNNLCILNNYSMTYAIINVELQLCNLHYYKYIVYLQYLKYFSICLIYRRIVAIQLYIFYFVSLYKSSLQFFVAIITLISSFVSVLTLSIGL